MSPEISHDVRVSRWFDASPERVFDAWLTPGLVGKWMFGPALRDEEVLRIELDAQVGGTFSFLVRRQGELIDHVGRYLEIDRPLRLVFTWGTDHDPPDSSRVSIDIVRLENGAELTLLHQLHPEWADYAGRVEAAWTKMLDTLDETLTEQVE
jgi:uncharacterized protein YndB with AHSA1/START domain